VVGPLPVRGRDLDDVAVDDLGLQGHPAAVDPTSNAGVSDLGVDSIGKIEDGRPAGKGEDVATRREAVDLVGIEVDLQRI
jgi:hypothetical protein